MTKEYEDLLEKLAKAQEDITLYKLIDQNNQEIIKAKDAIIAAKDEQIRLYKERIRILTSKKKRKKP